MNESCDVSQICLVRNQRRRCWRTPSLFIYSDLGSSQHATSDCITICQHGVLAFMLIALVKVERDCRKSAFSSTARVVAVALFCPQIWLVENVNVTSRWFFFTQLEASIYSAGCWFASSFRSVFLVNNSRVWLSLAEELLFLCMFNVIKVIQMEKLSTSDNKCVIYANKQLRILAKAV